MRDIAELTVLLRVRTEMPEGLKLTRDEFREGWNRLRTGNAKGLEKKIKAHKWDFTPVAKCTMAAGMGETSQRAIACALDHALAQVGADLDAIEVRNIQSTQYPWFWLARVSVYAFRIQPREPVAATEGVSLPNLAINEQLLAHSVNLGYNNSMLLLDRVSSSSQHLQSGMHG
jgi:hypothetical protein